MSEEEIDYKIRQNQLRHQLQQLLQQESFNFLLDMTNISCSLLLIFEYIYSTYDPGPWLNQSWAIINTLIHTFLLAEWLLKIYTAKNQITFLLSQESLVQTFSLIPYFILRLSALELFDETRNSLVQFSNLLSLLRLLELDRCRRFLDSEVNKQLLSIMLSIATLVIVSAGTLHFNAMFNTSPVNSMKYHYFIYLVMTTISTIGYENPFTSSESRILLIILVCFAFSFVPWQSSELIRHLSSKSYYARRNYKASPAIPHIVIMGAISTIAAENFFKELFHEDHGAQMKHAVLLAPNQPDPLLETLIRSPEYESNVIYIQGDPLLDKDLKRCQIEKSKAIVLMCNKQSADASAEDSRTILLAMVIKKYLKTYGQQSSKIRFCMQLLRHEGKTHYYLSLNKQTKQDQVICIEELKMSLLAKSCLCPGLITVISNLISSSGEPPQIQKLPHEWLHQYWLGQGFEIYKTQLPNFFRGKTFCQTVLIIYKKFEAVLFGIEIISDDQERIFLNPGELKLPENNEEKIMGYIISQDKSCADEIMNYKQTKEQSQFTFRQVQKQKTTEIQRASVMPVAKNSISTRQSLIQKIQTFFGMQAKKQSSKITRTKSQKTNMLVQGKSVGGWIKMKSYHPSSQTINNNPFDMDQIEQQLNQQENEVDEDEEELEENNTDTETKKIRNTIKTKYKQENFRNFLQTDINRIDQKCHLTNEKVSLKDVSFKTLEGSILAQNHVILCGLVSNLINFVVPLRAKYLTTYLPIVILNEQEPTEKQWNQICFFPEIYFVKGSAMNHRDLIRSNIKQATKVVILSPRVEEISHAVFDDEQQADEKLEIENIKLCQQLTRDQEDLLDAKTIFKYRSIVKIKPDIQIVTELISAQNLSFLIYEKDYALMKKYGFSHVDKQLQFFKTPIFASGQIYFSSIMDSLLCQAYYNPALITVLYQLLVGNFNSQSSEYKTLYSDVKTSNLFQMMVPSAFLVTCNIKSLFQDKSFEKLFFFLVKIKMIVPMGLYRLSQSQDNTQAYVWTNPTPDTILNQRDLLLVLAQEVPPSDYLNWGGPLEMLDMAPQDVRNIFLKQATDSTNEEGEIILLNEDNDKEVLKAKQMNQETDQVLKRIVAVSEEIATLKSEADELNQALLERQDRIILKIKNIFTDELLCQINQKKMKDQNEVSANFTEKGSDEP